MTTSDMIKKMRDRIDISVPELVRKIGQSPQDINKRLLRETVPFLKCWR